MGLCLKHFSTTRNGRKHTIVMNVFRILTKLSEMGPGMIELRHLKTISDKDASMPKLRKLMNVRHAAVFETLCVIHKFSARGLSLPNRRNLRNFRNLRKLRNFIF